MITHLILTGALGVNSLRVPKNKITTTSGDYMLLKMIEKILIKFLFKIQEKLSEKSEKNEKKTEKITKNRVANPMDFGVYTGWKPSKETLREYEIRKGINVNTPTLYTHYTEIEYEEESNPRESDAKKGIKMALAEAVVGGVVEEVVEEEFDSIKEKVEDIKDEIEEKLGL